MSPRRRFAWALSGVFALASTVAVAPARADGAATADALFRAGRASMQRGDYADAAMRFTESLRVDPAPGTLLNLAIAEEKLGRLAAAWEHARSAAEQLSAADERQRLARELFAALDQRTPRLLLRASALPRDARVTLDGAELRSASFDVAIPVDPGVHRVAVEAPGHVERVLRIEASEGRVARGELECGPAIVVGSAVREPVAAAPSPSPPSSPLRTVGWVSLGAGTVAAIAGGAFGVLAVDRNATVEDRCSGRFCDEDGAAAARDGRTFATVSTAAFVAAAAFAAGGLVMLLVSPRSTPAARSALLRF